VPGEKDLALFAVNIVRHNGGVLEHPEASSLWAVADLPRPGAKPDSFGGWTFPIAQYWFGHRAMKMTWLYIVGVPPISVPKIPLVLGDSPRVIAQGTYKKGCPQWRPRVTLIEREATPIELAKWLLEVAARCAL
jgi:hypothetical protein